MKISQITIRDFLGIKHVAAEFGAVTLFGGGNWTGKTSIQQAVRMALTGEIARAKLLKRDYGMLVREGAKQCRVEVTAYALRANVEITAAGKANLVATADVPTAHLFLLDQHRFSSIEPIARRQFLFDLCDVGASSAEVLRRIGEAGGDVELAREVMPLLRSGFPAAAGEAESNVKAARAQWKGITGETYGEKKAEGWRPKDGELRANLTAEAGSLKKHKELLKIAQDELVDFEKQVITMRAEAQVAGAEITCPDCGSVFRVDEARAEEVKARLPEHETSLNFLRSAATNRQRNIDRAAQAAEQLQRVDEELAKKEADAKAAHERALAWAKIRELLAPDGIPGDLLADALKPINGRLRHSAEVTGWGQVAIRPDMSIVRDNRLLELCSEAEQWTADAMLADAIAFLSGEKFVMLDRVDVLGVKERGTLLRWCDTLVEEGYQIVLFATLKQMPEMPGIVSYWLEAGEIVASSLAQAA